MGKTVYSEFQKHGNRIWHRCPLVIEEVRQCGGEVPEIVGHYEIIPAVWSDLSDSTDLAEISLVPMRKISGPGIIPCYFCPACMRAYSIEDVQSDWRKVYVGKDKTLSAKAHHAKSRRV